ncbi:MAG: flagellar motor protein MotB [Bryobacter sp.]|nr:flagellar motor protein MotB [Bryobacter sp.]
MEGGEQPIYIIKKKVHGHGHHGGAWKVAYADFVTAMMAFFMVMWLMGSSEKVKSAVSGYFRDPQGFKKQSGTGVTGDGEQITISKDDMEGLKEKIQSAMKQLPDFKQIRDHVSMTVTGEGLRIELMEKEGGMFFNSGSPAPSSFGSELLKKMASELSKLPNTIVIEGHTDAKPFNNEKGYSNWELSSDRANSARRLMTEHGLRPDQIKQVRGFADQRLMAEKDPNAAKNRRISVIVQYMQPTKEELEKMAKEAAEEEAKGGHGGGHGKDDHGKDDHGKKEGGH